MAVLVPEASGRPARSVERGGILVDGLGERVAMRRASQPVRVASSSLRIVVAYPTIVVAVVSATRRRNCQA